MDSIKDFAIGTDKIDLLTQSGTEMNAPVAFTRAADSTTTQYCSVSATNKHARVECGECGECGEN